jgi:hypothetical protein
MMTDGMGGMSAAGIRLALECEGVPTDQWKYVTQKILAYLNTALTKSKETPPQDKTDGQ